VNRSLFATTLSIPSNEIGKYVGLRTYHHPLVIIRLRPVCQRPASLERTNTCM